MRGNVDTTERQKKLSLLLTSPRNVFGICYVFFSFLLTVNEILLHIKHYAKSDRRLCQGYFPPGTSNLGSETICPDFQEKHNNSTRMWMIVCKWFR